MIKLYLKKFNRQFIYKDHAWSLIFNIDGRLNCLSFKMFHISKVKIEIKSCIKFAKI